MKNTGSARFSFWARSTYEVGQRAQKRGAGEFLMVTTNAGDDEDEVTQLYVRAGGQRDAFGDWRFCIENAEPFLLSAFDRVELHLEESQFVVRDVGPVRNTFESMRYLLEPGLDRTLPWATFLGRVCDEASRVIDAEGSSSTPAPAPTSAAEGR